MKRLRMAVLLIVVILAFAGCKSKNSKVKIDTDNIVVNTIAIEKSGIIQAAVLEDFDKDYYTKEDLEAYLNSVLEVYNGNTDDLKVEMDYLDVEKGIAKLLLKYKSMEEYAAFNGIEAAYMTVEEADKAGILPEKLVDKQSGEAVERKTIAENDSYHVVVLNEEYDVKVDGEILYYLNGVILGNSSIQTTNENGASFVVFK